MFLKLLLHFVSLISLALALELAEPAFGHLVGDGVDHPLGEAAHDVEAVHEEDICHVLLQKLVVTPAEHEPYYD